MSRLIKHFSVVGDQPGPEGSSIQDSLLNPTLTKYKAYSRSLPRDGMIALHCLDQMREFLPHESNKDKWGIYSAFLNGPLLYSLLDSLKNKDYEEAFTEARTNWPPKQHFKQNAPLRATHFALQLNSKGPQMCFTDPLYGLVDAMNAAEIDLFTGEVEFALVMSSFSLEDPQIAHFYNQFSSKIYEAGLCLLLKKDESLIQWKLLSPQSSTPYGICSPFLANNLTEFKGKKG